MGLIHNQNAFSMCGGVRAWGANRSCTSRVLRNPFGSLQNRFTYFDEKVATPPGYLHPMAIVLPKSAGGLGTSSTPYNTGTVSGTLAAGFPVTASLTGTVAVFADLTQLVEVAASLAASGLITNADLTRVFEILADLSASGTVTDADLAVLAVVFGTANLSALGTLTDAQMGAVISMISNISASVSVQANNFATFNLEADITPFTELSPQSLADAVWSAQADENNLVGTMGEKLNDAGAAGNPWAANLVDNNNPGTFGAFVQKLLSVAKFLGLK